MFKLAEMFVNIKANQQPFDKALDSVHSRLSTANVAVGTFAGNVASMFARAAAGFAGQAFESTIKSASSLNESLDKTRVIFGAAGQSIIDEANRMANAFQVPKKEFLDAADNFGAIFKSVGKTQEESAKLGVDLAKLALDMASLEETSPADAFTALASALRGENEPIARYRVTINEYTMAQEAMRQGIQKTGNTYDDASKKAIILGLIMKGTTDAQGNLAQTFGGTANQMKAFWGTVSNLSQSIGTELLPAFDQLLAIGNRAVQSLAVSFDSGKESFNSFIDDVVGYIDTAVFAFNNFSDIWALASVDVAEGVANILSYFQNLGANIISVAEYIGNNWYKLIADAFSATGAVITNFIENAKKLVAGLMTGDFDFEWTPLLDGWTATAEKMKDASRPVWVSMQKERDEILGRVGQRESERLARQEKAGKELVGPPREAMNKAAQSGALQSETFKSQILASADFANRLRESQLNGVSNIPQQQLDVQREGLTVAKDTLKEVKKPRMAQLA